MSISSTRPPAARLTRRLLACGAIGAPLFLAVILVQGVFRPGYSALRNTGSELAIGPSGWVQDADFLVCGLLLIAFAVGLRRALYPGPSSVLAALLAAAFGFALATNGIFVSDPGHGYPPGTPLGHTSMHTRHGTAHNIASTVVFLALAALCFALAVRFVRRRGQRLWATYSAASGLAVLTLIQGLAVEGYAGLFQRLTIAVGWGWITAIALWLRGREPRTSVAGVRNVTEVSDCGDHP